MSYAQARLRLGIVSVGWWVVLAALGLLTGMAGRLALWELSLLYAAASFPLDLLGGQLLPRMFRRPHLAWGRWTLLYLRSLILHLGLWTAALGLLCEVHHGMGRGLALLAFAILVIAFWKYQMAFLQWQGVALTRHPFGMVAAAADSRFSGGLAGLPWPGREQLLVPALWLSDAAPEGLEQGLRRRRQLGQGAARAAGCWLALAFNLGVLGQSLLASGGNPGLLVCASTLGNFVELLLLPSLSRAGVVSADRQSPVPQAWQDWMERLQEEDPHRSPWIERIFHPIPSRSIRATAPAPDWHPWNLARSALVTSTLMGSLLSRAVHCNIGRPELWFWPPND